MKMNDKLYNILKWVCLTALPALTALYGVIGSTLNIPHTQEVLTIATAVDTCLGTMIGVSAVKYYQSQAENPDVGKIMKAVETYFAKNAVNASDVDVPEE